MVEDMTAALLDRDAITRGSIALAAKMKFEGQLSREGLMPGKPHGSRFSRGGLLAPIAALAGVCPRCGANMAHGCEHSAPTTKRRT